MAINHLELFTLASNASLLTAPPLCLRPHPFRDSVGFLWNQLPALRCIKEGPRRGSLMFVHKQEAEEEDSGRVPAGARVPHTNEGINERWLTEKKTTLSFSFKTCNPTFSFIANHF